MWPTGWRWARLGDVCRVVGGSTPSSGIEDFWGGDIVWITPTDLGRLRGQLITNSARQITKSGYECCGTELVPVGSVVLSSRAPIGHLGIAGVPLCTNQGCKTFIPGDGVESLFLYFSLKEAVPTLQALGSGATFKEISKSDLERYEIALPPLAEQKRIAAILNEQMAAVERARAAAEARLEAAKALPAAYLRAVFSSPESHTWDHATVGAISSLVIDGPHVTPSYVPSGVPFLTIRNIVNRRIDLTDVSYVSPVDHAEFTRRGKAESGDILYTKDGTMGVPCVVDSNLEFSFFVSVALIKLMHGQANSLFVAFALESPDVMKQVEKLGAGAGLKHMVLKSIRALMIPLPDLATQQRIVTTLNEQMASAHRARKAVEEELDAINKLPAALLRRAFSGGL